MKDVKPHFSFFRVIYSGNLCYVTITRKNDSNRFYLHEVWTEKSLTNVGSNTAQGQSSHLQGVAKILQNIVSASNNVSKVVDENGEPMVVYHGTAYDFNVFDESQSGKSTGNNGWFGKGFYFAPLKSNANGYAHGASHKAELLKLSKEERLKYGAYISNDTDVSDDVRNEGREIYERVMRNANVGKKLKEVFLNIRNPQVVSISEWNNNFIQDEDADGVIATIETNGKKEVYEIKAILPNQIKSATDNAGTFDSENPDIRFSLSTEIEKKYPNWMDNQTPDDKEGKRGQNTQVATTTGTYKKVGKWVEDNLGKDKKILG